MRKLAIFSLLFAVGCLPVLLEWPLPVCLLLLIAAALLCIAGFLLKGRRERIAAIGAAGLLCGLLWTAGYRQVILAPVQALETESAMISLTLTRHPLRNDYGWYAEGITETGGRRFRTAVYLDEETDASGWKPGDTVTGVCRLSAGGANSGGTDHRSVGLLMRAAFGSGVTAEPCERIPIRYLPAHASHILRETVRALYPEDVRGYVTALLTGEKDEISDCDRLDLQIAGVYHALAVSGMHVSILMSVLAVVTLKNRRLYPLIGIPMLIFYCVMIGGNASVIRAALMHLFLMSAGLLRRDPDGPTSLGAALLLLTAQNPWCLLNVGLQLSFLATAGILAFCGPLYQRFSAHMPGKGRRLLRAVYAVAACTVSALSLTLPVMAVCFGVVSTMSVLTNLLVLQAITGAFFFGFLSCFGAWIAPWLGAAFAAPVILLIRYTAWCCGAIAALPFAAIYPQTSYLSLWFAASYLVLLCGLLLRKRLRPRFAAVAAVCVAASLCVSLLLTKTDRLRDELRFTALDVGNGQCLLLSSGSQTAAIDCGGAAAGEALGRALLSGGARRLDVLILSHFDPTHTDGLETLLHLVEVGMIYLPDVADVSGSSAELEQLAREKQTPMRYLSSDLTLSLGSGTVRMIAPLQRDGGPRSCMSVLASFDGFDILACGDLPSAGEIELLRSAELPDIEVLVAGNHGASSSTDPLLLAVLQPEVLVISVGKNGIGLPSERVLSCAQEIGAKVYRTDIHGNVTIRR